jgi:nucleoside-diphosphate-sugar epimerase
MKNDQIHTVLGAAGAVGQAVIAELQAKGLSVRGVGRSLKRSDIAVVKADLLQIDQAKAAIEGSSHVYLCVGLPYESKVWRRDWPILMQHVIEACKMTEARLVFLDNVYLYGPSPLSVPFDETHSQQPATEKGKVRKQTRDILWSAIESNAIKAVMGRAADFYGPKATYSPFYISFLERMLQGKNPQSVATPGKLHTYANVSDLGRALVALALDPSTYGQAWHLPVGEPITVTDMLSIFNEEMGTNFKVSFLPPFVRKLLAFFMPPLKEVGEMMYQFESDYVMSFDKFKTHFPDFKVSTYQEGVKDMVASFR